MHIMEGMCSPPIPPCTLYYFLLLPSDLAQSSSFQSICPSFAAIFRTSPKTKHCDADFLDIHASPPTFNSIHNSKLLQALTAATSAWQTPRNKRARRWTREPADRSGLGAKAGRRRRGRSTTRSDASTTATSERPHCLGTNDGKSPKMFPSKVPVTRSTHTRTQYPQFLGLIMHILTRLPDSSVVAKAYNVTP